MHSDMTRRSMTIGQLTRIILAGLLIWLSSFSFAIAGSPLTLNQPGKIVSTPVTQLEQNKSPEPDQESSNSPASSTSLSSAKVEEQGASQSQSQKISRPEDYPTGLYQAYLNARQAEGGVEYEVQVSSEGSLTASNPTQQLSASFGKAGTSIANLQLKLSRIGYAAQPETALQIGLGTEPIAQGNRITYQHSPILTEWYLNGPAGLEQGFTLTQALPIAEASQNQELELEMNLSGVKRASLNAAGNELALTLTDERQLNYGQLYVYDASGQSYPAHFNLTALSNGDFQLILTVSQLAKVTYPLTIDPLFTQSQMLSDTSGGAASDQFSNSVALSSDGNTALIGADNKTIGSNYHCGIVYVFIRGGAGAIYVQSQVLSDTVNNTNGDNFGKSLTLLSDGNTALIGVYNKPSGPIFSKVQLTFSLGVA